ncbi:hypothetical protein COHA_000337 [Chlorella ohadii]|uniref:Uncharacterized protein n=1 Tax=Chlorella ohadii TaxID=2649997 RepID=A0AAD5DXC3_9CHLO|nr:hypothetical protein COHA_000337 [Chlorella ohadii]
MAAGVPAALEGPVSGVTETLADTLIWLVKSHASQNTYTVIHGGRIICGYLPDLLTASGFACKASLLMGLGHPYPQASKDWCNQNLGGVISLAQLKEASAAFQTVVGEYETGVSFDRRGQRFSVSLRPYPLQRFPVKRYGGKEQAHEAAIAAADEILRARGNLWLISRPTPEEEARMDALLDAWAGRA